MAKLWSKDDQ